MARSMRLVSGASHAPRFEMISIDIRTVGDEEVAWLPGWYLRREELVTPEMSTSSSPLIGAGGKVA